MRTSLTIDDELLEKAAKLTDIREKEVLQEGTVNGHHNLRIWKN